MSSANKNRTRSESPNKQEERKGDGNYVVIDQELIRGLSEKEIELEHHKTMIVALNQKVEVTESIKRDLTASQEEFVKSEASRKVLQMKLTEFSQTQVTQVDKCKKYEEILTQENEQLNKQVNQQLETINALTQDLQGRQHDNHQLQLHVADIDEHRATNDRLKQADVEHHRQREKQHKDH